jgi:hypothetical protein
MRDAHLQGTLYSGSVVLPYSSFHNLQTLLLTDKYEYIMFIFSAHLSFITRTLQALK